MKKRLSLAVVFILLLVVFTLPSPGVEVRAGLFQSPPPTPPPNDDFDNATMVSGLPYTDVLDTTYATWASDDPWDCHSNGSVWYAFTPNSDTLIEANTIGSDYDTTLGAYTGTRGALEMVPDACNDDYNGTQSRVVFDATAGTTYYFLVGRCCGQGGDGGGYLVFTVQEYQAPAPEAYIYFYPYDPSVFDTVWFDNWSYDPAGIGIESQVWNFGDGNTSTEWSTGHQYAADGDYAVQLTVTTYDGRSASTTQTVSVRTHDVAITKFLVPKSATAGQTRSIVVGLNSKRYPERVHVELQKSVPGGYEWVGGLVQSVPVRPANRTTDFSFNYTFTAADAKMGKVTFRAVAYVQDARDALPADNEAIATPTKVTR